MFSMGPSTRSNAVTILAQCVSVVPSQVGAGAAELSSGLRASGQCQLKEATDGRSVLALMRLPGTRIEASVLDCAGRLRKIEGIGAIPAS
jgi:hypothetical protein